MWWWWYQCDAQQKRLVDTDKRHISLKEIKNLFSCTQITAHLPVSARGLNALASGPNKMLCGCWYCLIWVKTSQGALGSSHYGILIFSWLFLIFLGTAYNCLSSKCIPEVLGSHFTSAACFRSVWSPFLQSLCCLSFSTLESLTRPSLLFVLKINPNILNSKHSKYLLILTQ